MNVTAVFRLTLRLRLAVALGLAALAIAVYIPAQLLPLIADDYVQIDLGRKFGPMSAWPDLASDALYRCRATSILITHWTEEIFGFSPAVFKATSLFFHVMNVLLVAALGCWRPIGWRVSVAAAAYFAIAEGHHEAVIWYAALPELLVFTFVLGGFLAWVGWLQSEQSNASLFYIVSLICFVAALLSKESAVCLVALQGIAVIATGKRKLRHWIGMIPFGALSLAYFISTYLMKSTHLHFNDGTFSLTAPFWLTLVNTVGRMVWFWGLIAMVVLAAQRTATRKFVLIITAWLITTLLPYSFLTYMSRVPSRHTYLASVAVACIVGAAMVSLRERWPRKPRLAAALALLIALHNFGYLWTRKQRQFADRAAPTKDLIDFSRTYTGPIYVKCFPYGPDVAELALAIEAGEDPVRLKWVNPPTCKGHAYAAGPLPVIASKPPK